MESALFATLLPLGDQLITEMKTQPKLLPVFVDFFQSLMLLAGTGNIRGHLSLVQVVEKWFPDCVSMLSEENDAALLLGPQLSGPVATMLQYLSHLYSAVLFLTNMLKCNEKRNAANEEDSPLVVSPHNHGHKNTCSTCMTVFVALVVRSLLLLFLLSFCRTLSLRMRKMESHPPKMMITHREKTLLVLFPSPPRTHTHTHTHTLPARIPFLLFLPLPPPLSFRRERH